MEEAIQRNKEAIQTMNEPYEMLLVSRRTSASAGTSGVEVSRTSPSSRKQQRNDSMNELFIAEYRRTRSVYFVVLLADGSESDVGHLNAPKFRFLFRIGDIPSFFLIKKTQIIYNES